MIRKLSDDQLKRYVDAQETKAAKMHVTVDEKHRKNLQAWIPFDLWTSVKARLASDNMSMNKLVEQALATYLLLEDADIERIMERHVK